MLIFWKDSKRKSENRKKKKRNWIVKKKKSNHVCSVVLGNCLSGKKKKLHVREKDIEAETKEKRD